MDGIVFSYLKQKYCCMRNFDLVSTKVGKNLFTVYFFSSVAILFKSVGEGTGYCFFVYSKDVESGSFETTGGYSIL